MGCLQVKQAGLMLNTVMNYMTKPEIINLHSFP
jgi:hypothetical protein